MSVQLIVFPQYFNGNNPLISSQEFVVDGIVFGTVNSSTSAQSIVGTLPQQFMDNNTSGTGYSGYLTAVNTWVRFSSIASEVVENNGEIGVTANLGISQRLSNLTVGASYTITFDIVLNTSGFEVYQYTTNILQSNQTVTGTGLQTIQFTAGSTSDVIALFGIAVSTIKGISITETGQAQSVNIENGQVILDLYEDEDIPLSLSVDDFKNVAEKVQSYSKAFNLPATKRNNKIFDNIFEVTRIDTGLNFNPYKKTKCILKQDGFLLFEGYLRMIDISEKSGEISYNVNLYSEAVALADVLADRTFSDLDFTELEHLYNKTNIKNSWNDAGTGIAYTNSSTSGFRDAYTTLRYPFIDWEHQIAIGGSTGTNATVGSPELLYLENAFRPTINVRYLLDRIFQATPFTFTSAFFDTNDFKKLYMDFNWGGDRQIEEGSGVYDGSVTNFATGSFQNLILTSNDFPSDAGYNTTTHKFTASYDNQTYTIEGNYTVALLGSNTVNEFRWVHTTASGSVFIGYYNPFLQVSPVVNSYPINRSWTLNQNDTLEFQYKANDTASKQLGNTSINVITNLVTTTSNILLQTLRGELGQFEFLKGIMTMFNLVAIPDEDSPNNILIEPYGDIFLDNDDSKQLDWTDKIDVTEMKLVPLTNLNRKTTFRFVEDEDDYVANVIKKSTGGNLYGSLNWTAFLYDILSGEEEIIAEPFAATVPKALESQFFDLIVPTIYSMNDEGTSESFDNSPRIFYNNGVKSAADGNFISCTYYIPAQNGVTSENATQFLQFSHFDAIPTDTTVPSTTLDFNFETQQTLSNIGTTPLNLFNLYWLPYYNELYNPDTRTMTIKVNLTPSDINSFNFYDTVIIKNRTYRVNKIDYKPNDLATVEFILIP